MAKPTFISPTVDYAFKKIFGSDRSEDILLSFLNAIIYNLESAKFSENLPVRVACAQRNPKS